MSAPSLTITYAVPSALVEDRYWLRLEQEGIAEQVATVTDTANLLDALFQIDKCDPASATETGDEPAAPSSLAMTADGETPLTGDDLSDAAKEALDLAICDTEPDGSVNVTLLVIRAHLNRPYRLRVSGGSVTQTVVVSKEIDQFIPIENADRITLDWPVVSGFTADWLGLVRSADGLEPVIRRLANTLYWDGQATGSLQVRYTTIYDAVTVKVHGVGGEQGQALVRCFSHGLVEELEPELPDPDDVDRSICDKDWRFDLDWPEPTITCYKEIEHRYLCSCSKEEVDELRRYYQQVVPCPDHVVKCPGGLSECMHLVGSEVVEEYVSCPGDTDNYADIEFYSRMCCQPPPSLPKCKDEVQVWKGGVQIKPSPAYHIGIHGPTTRIVPIQPDGGICGEWVTSQRIGGSCCVDVPPMEAYPDNPTSMGAGDSVLLQVERGRQWVSDDDMWEWTASGGLFFEGGFTRIMAGRSAWVYSPNDWCTRGYVRVDDRCTTLSMHISNRKPPDPLGIDGDDHVVAPGGYLVVYAAGGLPPYHWSGSSDLTLVSPDSANPAVFIASLEFCGTSAISVSDACAVVVTEGVRSTEGLYEIVPENEYDRCSPPGAPYPTGSYIVGGAWLSGTSKGHRAVYGYDISDQVWDVCPGSGQLECPMDNRIVQSTAVEEASCAIWNQPGVYEAEYSDGCCAIYNIGAARWAYQSYAQYVGTLHRWVCG